MFSVHGGSYIDVIRDVLVLLTFVKDEVIWYDTLVSVKDKVTQCIIKH